MVWLYLIILLVVAAALWGAYRVLGTPSHLSRADYALVLDDLLDSVERAAARLRAALDSGAGQALEEVAAESRKVFQTGYYQTLRLRPATGADAADARRQLGGACEGYEWASRMLGSESAKNPLVLEAARRLLDAGDLTLRRAAGELRPALAAAAAAAGESSAPSPQAPPRVG